MTDADLQQLLDRFWSGEASEPERHKLLNYLDTHHRELRTMLERTYGQDERSAALPEIGASRAGEWLRKIHVKAGIAENVPYRHVRVRPAIWIAAAAVLVLGFSLVFVLYRHQRADTVRSAQIVGVPESFVHRNTGREDLPLTLPDSSTVVLSPQSELTYSASYGAKARGVALRGKALFRVKPNGGKPFTVYANGFATTALGTEFMVSTRQAGATTVRLLSGKVVVTATASSPFAMEAIYLKPGDELHIDALEEKLSVVKTPHTPSPNAVKTKSVPVVAADVAGGLHFNRTPLTEVFQRIATVKGVRILVDRADLDGLSFSGELLPTDALEVMLSMVCTMNDLSYRYENDRIVIVNK